MLEIVNLTKKYGKDKEAVKNLSIKVEPGDLYGFIGHNGAGKTTTIKSIAGILDFDEGDILIDSLSIKKDPQSCKSKIAYIPDNPDIYDYLTGSQYLNFICDIFEVMKDQRESLIEKYASIFKINASLGKIISSYSHGMKQKLALISALVHSPDILVLDEPFVGLDPEASHSLKEIMKSLCKKGKSIFFSTHILEVAEKLCNKIGIIRNGELIVSGATKDIVGNKGLEEVFMEVME